MTSGALSGLDVSGGVPDHPGCFHIDVVVGCGLKQHAWVRFAQAAGWTGLAFFGGGLLLSIVAAQINWGGVGLTEPRMASSTKTYDLLVHHASGDAASARVLARRALAGNCR